MILSQVLVASWKRIYIWKDPAVETAGYPYNVPNGTNMPEALDKDSQPFQWLGNSRRYKRIGASECLERERGPGGPPSDQRERVCLWQTKKRWQRPLSERAGLYAGDKKGISWYCLKRESRSLPFLKRPGRKQYCNKQLIQKKKAPQIVL